MMKFRNSQWRGWALFWSLFIGLSAIAGGCGMLADISGQTLRLDTLLPMMQVLPFSDYLFQDFLFSGVALIVLIGATNLLAFFSLLARRNFGISFSIVCGIILMVWTGIQFLIFPLNTLSPLYFLFGLLQIVTAVKLRRSDIYEHRRNSHHSMF
jgi:hypothetical protein